MSLIACWLYCIKQYNQNAINDRLAKHNANLKRNQQFNKSIIAERIHTPNSSCQVVVEFNYEQLASLHLVDENTIVEYPQIGVPSSDSSATW